MTAPPRDLAPVSRPSWAARRISLPAVAGSPILSSQRAAIPTTVARARRWKSPSLRPGGRFSSHPPKRPRHSARRSPSPGNGSSEAARAIGAGLPFLRAAESVSVLVVPEGARSGAPVGDVIDYLACHGVDASARPIDASEAKIGGALMEAASAAGIDMLVMGAYTHSRLRHLIFGGATSAILQHADFPVLMQH